jgi:hypothetical protein
MKEHLYGQIVSKPSDQCANKRNGINHTLLKKKAALAVNSKAQDAEMFQFLLLFPLLNTGYIMHP